MKGKFTDMFVMTYEPAINGFYGEFLTYSEAERDQTHKIKSPKLHIDIAMYCTLYRVYSHLVCIHADLKVHLHGVYTVT